MDEDEPPSKSEKPRFLLPNGCKDLIDLIRLQQKAEEETEDSDPEITFGE